MIPCCGFLPRPWQVLDRMQATPSQAVVAAVELVVAAVEAVTVVVGVVAVLAVVAEEVEVEVEVVEERAVPSPGP
jgi:hypothetical protein